jgi:hypothetical protein
MEQLTFAQLRKKVGDLSQIAGIRAIEFTGGKAKDTAAFEVYNAAGLCYTVLADKCMDVFDLKFKGHNIGFTTKNGLVANKFFNALDNEFLYYWSAGMMYTCGLANTGPACEDAGLYRTEHGRIGCVPAQNVCAEAAFEGGDYRMRLSGEMRESMVYGSNLSLKRRIETTLYAKEILIRDTVVNLEPADEEFMLLYHFNFGYPLVDEGARIIKPEGSVTPRTPEAAKGVDSCRDITAPVDNSDEECFFHGQSADKDGFAYVGIVNERLGLGAYLKYSLGTLPVLVEWKSPRSHDYCIGLEPGNSYIMGRAPERENGTLQKITGYSQIDYTVTLGLLDGAEEIKHFEEKLKRI